MQLDVQWFIYALADNDIVSAEDAVQFNDDLGGDPTLEVFVQELLAAISAELTVIEKAEINMKFQKITRFAISQASAGVSPSIFEIVEEPVAAMPAAVAAVPEDDAAELEPLTGLLASGGLMLCTGADPADRQRLIRAAMRRLDSMYAGHMIIGGDDTGSTGGLQSEVTFLPLDGNIVRNALEMHGDVLVLPEIPAPETVAPLLECAAGGMAVLVEMPDCAVSTVLQKLIRMAPPANQHWARLLLAEAWRGTADPAGVICRNAAQVCAIVENRLENGE